MNNAALVDSNAALQAVIDAGLLEKVLEMQKHAKMVHKPYLCRVLQDAVENATFAQSVRLVEIGVARGLCKLVSAECEDVVEGALTSLHVLLMRFGPRSGAGATLRRVVAEVVECGALEELRGISLSTTLPKKISTLARDVGLLCENV